MFNIKSEIRHTLQFGELLVLFSPQIFPQSSISTPRCWMALTSSWSIDLEFLTDTNPHSMTRISWFLEKKMKKLHKYYKIL